MLLACEGDSGFKIVQAGVPVFPSALGDGADGLRPSSSGKFGSCHSTPGWPACDSSLNSIHGKVTP